MSTFFNQLTGGGKMETATVYTAPSRRGTINAEEVQLRSAPSPTAKTPDLRTSPPDSVVDDAEALLMAVRDMTGVMRHLLMRDTPEARKAREAKEDEAPAPQVDVSAHVNVPPSSVMKPGCCGAGAGVAAGSPVGAFDGAGTGVSVGSALTLGLGVGSDTGTCGVTQ